MQDEVLDFINRRWKKDADWCNGNCYWFCAILCKRFPYLEAYFIPVDSHFVAGHNNKFYDWNGEYVPEYKPILFEDIKKDDILWYNRLIRDCAL